MQFMSPGYSGTLVTGALRATQCPTRMDASHNLSRLVYARKFVSESTGRQKVEGVENEIPMATVRTWERSCVVLGVCP
jgi:hypothetical protein